MKLESTAGDNHRSRKVSSSDVRKIRQLYAEGMKPKAIAAMFNIKPNTAANIANRRCWKSVE